MRLDKYLKVSRLIKRRTLAKEVAENERILVNDKLAKPSKELKIGDIITIEFGNKIVKVRVISLEVSVKKSDATSLYEFISEEKKELIGWKAYFLFKKIKIWHKLKKGIKFILNCKRRDINEKNIWYF